MIRREPPEPPLLEVSADDDEVPARTPEHATRSATGRRDRARAISMNPREPPPCEDASREPHSGGAPLQAVRRDVRVHHAESQIVGQTLPNITICPARNPPNAAASADPASHASA